MNDKRTVAQATRHAQSPRSETTPNPFDRERPHFDPCSDISEFHAKFLLTYDGPPRFLPVGIDEFRRQFLMEELKEYEDSCFGALMDLSEEPHLDEAAITTRLADQLDALVDLVYVALGTAYLHGFDFREAWRRVHEANMAKIRTERVEDSTRGSTYDVVKPKGWTPPSHDDLVEAHAHRKPR